MTVVSFVAEAENQVYSMTAADAAALIDFYNTNGAYGPELLARIGQFANQDTRALS